MQLNLLSENPRKTSNKLILPSKSQLRQAKSRKFNSNLKLLLEIRETGLAKLGFQINQIKRGHLVGCPKAMTKKKARLCSKSNLTLSIVVSFYSPVSTGI